MTLRSLFHLKARPKQAPRVLADITCDVATRGDIHGFKGLAKIFTHMINGTLTEIDLNALSQAEAGNPSTTSALLHYCEKNGWPDVFLGSCDKRIQRILKEHGTKCVFQRYTNETLSEIYLGNKEIVPHHLTRDKLAAAGNTFRKEYPDLPHPLIGVLLADLMNSDIDPFTDKLVAAARKHGQCTIFVSSSWRTDEDYYKKLMTKLEDKLAKQGLKEKVRLLDYDIHTAPKDTPNPYMGLLDQSDHVIVWGRSRSMVSEVLFTGKTPYIVRGEDIYPTLLQNGTVKSFNQQENGAPLTTEHIDPISVTEIVAQKMQKQYKATAGGLRWLPKLSL